ncbi:sacsin N-terminal ATP-binding-like domain-containing protein [Mucilaginibacter glaciei]|uniref:DUF3883 domain-containing protein n=1 Tax=Mucilaginibacter glaciei TaxID=2772109 RepID=A0A926NNC1_9SPHI|nr:hypothetical protein [Mucilaginibacter glaciei]MBD1395249.1 hypothetical protein [Mucilaginibacter glaciei]
MNDLSLSRVTAIFNKHYEYYQSIGIETIKQQAGQVEQVSADYQGRVIFELLQNAFDKADHSIKVICRDNCLYIANDGTPFTYRENYDYYTGKSGRADFQSLCSISTSTKDVNTSIGNKGVGFKSVFAISEKGSVIIHTVGALLSESEAPVSERISFQIFDQFKDGLSLPETLTDDPKAALLLQISQMQAERKDRGVPGYYYPVLWQNSDQQVSELFDQRYVTIIQIPFSAALSGEISSLLKEIEKIQFQFVRLRIPKNIQIEIMDGAQPGLGFIKRIAAQGGDIISCSLNEEARALGKAAGPTIEDPRVAIFFHDMDGGLPLESLLYNYLPTKVESPFYHVDFHADFHTTVDRKGINWDGKIGAYNRALMRGCLELYFHSLNLLLDHGDRQSLNIQVIELGSISEPAFTSFSWQHFNVSHTQEAYWPVRDILRISNHHYHVASDLIASLAKKYFSQDRTSGAHQLFFEHAVEFINSYSRNSGDSWDWPPYFKSQLGKALVRLDAKVIPAAGEGQHSLQEELIFREQQKDEIKTIIPSFVGINLTAFEVADKDLRKALNIKDFTDRNEILKHYRQVSPGGSFHGPCERYSEEQQKDLLTSISSMMGRTDNEVTCTHRYQGYLVSNTDNTAANLADFGLSTVFLKTTIGRYKPAQLCCRKEIDVSFIPALANDTSLETFLRYLGVSPHSSYLFVDKPMLDQLKDGLDYIPALWRRDRSAQEDALSYNKVLAELRVVHSGNEIHPALINDNRISFLKDLKVSEFKLESDDVLIKRYDLFPREYMRQLLLACQDGLHRKDQLLRLYQQLFEPLHHKLRTYLVSESDQLFFTQRSDFYIIASEADFQVAQQVKIPVLCYYKSRIDPEKYKLSGKMLDMEASDFLTTGEVDLTARFREALFPRLFYLLVELSSAEFSEADYFENPSRITELSKKLALFKFIEVDTLQREIQIGALAGRVIADKIFDYSDRCLYVRKDISTGERAEAIAKSIFNNGKFARTVELILFHKKEDALQKEYRQQTELYYQKFKSHWIQNYDIRFRQFSSIILSFFDGQRYEDDPQWFVYSRDYQSPFVLRIYQAGLVNELSQVITREGELFEEGIFSDFQIDIDFGLYRKEIIEIALALDRLPSKEGLLFRARLDALTGRLGVSELIKILREDIAAGFPLAFAKDDSASKQDTVSRQVELETKIKQLFNSFKEASQPVITSFTANEQNTVTAIPVKTRKVIYQGQLPSNETCKVIGNTGEEQVLYFLINYFIGLSGRAEKESALYEVHLLIQRKLGASASRLAHYQELYSACLRALDDTASLTVALIPFFYITLHYELAFVDLVAWHEGRAVLVEVKTTTSRGNKSFRLSESEVGQAIAQENYMIIRVTPDELILLGNPMFAIQEKLTEVRGSNFSIQPDGYKFSFFSQQ